MKYDKMCAGYGKSSIKRYFVHSNDTDFLDAIAYVKRRKGDDKNAILEAGKAFESTIKIICDKQDTFT